MKTLKQYKKVYSEKWVPLQPLTAPPPVSFQEIVTINQLLGCSSERYMYIHPFLFLPNNTIMQTTLYGLLYLFFLHNNVFWKILLTSGSRFASLL